MLSAPEYGWSTLTIVSWSDRCSYLDDVPVMLLRAMESVLRTGRPAVEEFDAEGWGYLIVFERGYIHIITESNDDQNGWKHYDFELALRDLAGELIEDVKSQLDGWVHWFCYSDEDDDYYSERKKTLLSMCDALEQQI